MGAAIRKLELGDVSSLQKSSFVCGLRGLVHRRKPSSVNPKANVQIICSQCNAGDDRSFRKARALSESFGFLELLVCWYRSCKARGAKPELREQDGG